MLIYYGYIQSERGIFMAIVQKVVFKLSGEQFGLDIKKVFGIEKMQHISFAPNAPEYIEGMINLRGEVYPIYNLRKRFNMKKLNQNEEQIVIVNTNNMKVGFIVDQVIGIENINDEDIEETPILIVGAERKYLDGVAKIGPRIIMFLDIDLLITDNELNEIGKIIDENN